MKEHLMELGEKIIRLKYDLSRDIDDIQKKHGELSYDSSASVIEIRAELFELLGMSLLHEKDFTEKFVEWGRKSGELAVQYDIPLHKALQGIRYYRTLVWKLIRQDMNQGAGNTDMVLETAEKLDTLLDEMIRTFSITFVEYNSRILGLAREAIEELSVPVVRLTRSIAVLPLIGTIDTHRSQLIMEAALEKCMELKVEQLFIDLSGVPIIDTMVAHNLFQVISALKLLGVEVTLSGMRPELAQTVVSLGISFDNISIAGSLHLELEKLGVGS